MMIINHHISNRKRLNFLAVKINIKPKSQNMKNVMKIAYVIGNGASRKDFDLMELKDKGKVFGCNALYRDYKDHVLPDYLVAIDNPIIFEIQKSNFPKERFLNPPEDEKWEPVELHWGRSATPDWNPARPRSNAGMNAILESIKKGYTTIYCFGFDFLVVDESIAMSNVYDDTNCYGLETRANISDTRNRMKYLGWLIEKHSTVNFVFCYPKGTAFYQAESENVSFCDFDQLKHLLME